MTAYNKSRNFAMIITLFLILNIIQILYMQSRLNTLEIGSPQPITAHATAYARVCINTPPVVFNECDMTIPWGYQYQCYVNATDINPESTFTFASQFLTNNTLFNINSDGLINVTPKKTDLGNHTIRIYVYDGTGCSNGVAFADYNIEIIDSNHAPIRIANISDQSLRRDQSYTFYLSTYIIDPDGDSLTYFEVKEAAENYTSITIDNSSLVVVKALDCGISRFYFVAADPLGLTNTTNTAAFTITGCAQTSSGNEQSGEGGGGGGGASEECISDWRCGQWSKCSINDSMYMRCVDHRACEEDNIRYFFKNCTYVPEEYLCQELWNCTPWSACESNTHARVCIDAHSCGTTVTKPLEQELCQPVASCFNGIKDNNETGVDCGGLCPACKIQENPSQIGYGNTMVYIVLLVLLILSIIIYAYRKSLSKMLKGWSMHKRKRKVVYITDVQKERLLQLHYVTQQRLNDHKEKFAIANLSIFMRLLFRELLAIDHVNQQELQDKLPVLRNKGLESILYTYYLKILEVETRRGGFENNELQAIIDETACVLYLISEFTEKDAMLTPKERILKVNELIDKDYLKLSNLYLALQFAELKEAKALYESLLKDYEALPALQKQLIFNDIMRAYTVMLYMEHQSK